MLSILLVGAKQHHDSLKACFAAQSNRVQCCQSAGEARRLLLQTAFDCVIINAPLPDEFGKDLAQKALQLGCEAVLLCNAAQREQLAVGVEKYGVFVLTKPLNRQLLSFSMGLIRTGRYRTNALREENKRLKKRLEEARILTQAKCCLARYQQLTEAQAHRLIEKRAMDERESIGEVAAKIVAEFEP